MRSVVLDHVVYEARGEATDVLGMYSPTFHKERVREVPAAESLILFSYPIPRAEQDWSNLEKCLDLLTTSIYVKKWEMWIETSAVSCLLEPAPTNKLTSPNMKCDGAALPSSRTLGTHTHHSSRLFLRYIDDRMTLSMSNISP